jgi:uncharacterized damage-inducible protein DinB
MSLRDHFLELARNNAWSNARLYGACRSLDAEALMAPRTSFFPSLFLTLQHLWIVDEYYVDGLEEAGRGARVWDDERVYADIEALWRAQHAVDRRLLAVCERHTDDTLRDARVTLQRRSRLVIDRAQDILAHLFVHQIHHRGQAHAMLAGTSIAPPQLDEWFLAADRPIAEAELKAAFETAR